MATLHKTQIIPLEPIPLDELKKFLGVEPFSFDPKIHQASFCRKHFFRVRPHWKHKTGKAMMIARGFGSVGLVLAGGPILGALGAADFLAAFFAEGLAALALATGYATSQRWQRHTQIKTEKTAHSAGMLANWRAIRELAPNLREKARREFLEYFREYATTMNSAVVYLARFQKRLQDLVRGHPALGEVNLDMIRSNCLEASKKAPTTAKEAELPVFGWDLKLVWIAGWLSALAAVAQPWAAMLPESLHAVVLGTVAGAPVTLAAVIAAAAKVPLVWLAWLPHAILDDVTWFKLEGKLPWTDQDQDLFLDLTGHRYPFVDLKRIKSFPADQKLAWEAIRRHGGFFTSIVAKHNGMDPISWDDILHGKYSQDDVRIFFVDSFAMLDWLLCEHH